MDEERKGVVEHFRSMVKVAEEVADGATANKHQIVFELTFQHMLEVERLSLSAQFNMAAASTLRDQHSPIIQAPMQVVKQ